VPRVGRAYAACMRRLVIGILLFAAACSAGPAAPAVEATERACVEQFCIVYPQGWEVVEEGDGFIVFSHDAAPGQANASIGPANMQALVENAGGSWPTSTEGVVKAFWQLLDEAEVADFERLERLTGGAFRSEGSYEDGRMWYLLIPGSGNRGVAVEVRGPNASWESHADVFFSNVEVFE